MSSADNQKTAKSTSAKNVKKLSVAHSTLIGGSLMAGATLAASLLAFMHTSSPLPSNAMIVSATRQSIIVQTTEGKSISHPISVPQTLLHPITRLELHKFDDSKYFIDAKTGTVFAKPDPISWEIGTE